MTVTMYGAGAIGGTVGAYLARAGVPVLLVDREAQHVEAMNRHGLAIRREGDSFTASVRAVTPDSLTGSLDLVLLAVKAQHTEDALRVIAPLLTPTSTVVSLQNGLCERVIADRIGADRTVGCLVNFAADYIEPGVIFFGGPGTIELGELDGVHRERLDTIRRLLSHLGEVKVTDNIWGYIWGKIGYANMLFATATTDETMADIIDRYRPLMIELATEIYEVAAREGVRPEAFDDVEPDLYLPREKRNWSAINRSLDALVARRHRDKKTHSGIWRDLAVRQRPTEVDYQIAVAARIGARHGLSMPLTHALVSMIHDLEAGRRERSLANVAELNALLPTHVHAV
jgi:2-dehydropantoate 2-reductase